MSLELGGRGSDSSAQGHTWADSLHGQRGDKGRILLEEQGNGNPCSPGCSWKGSAHSREEAAFQIKSQTKWKHSPP